MVTPLLRLVRIAEYSGTFGVVILRLSQSNRVPLPPISSVGLSSTIDYDKSSKDISANNLGVVGTSIANLFVAKPGQRLFLRSRLQALLKFLFH